MFDFLLLPHAILFTKNLLLTDKGEPESFEEANQDTHSHKWLSAMHDEMDSLHENHTYELTELPKGKRVLRNKWVYKLKPGDAENPRRYKYHIVVNGFEQEKELKFDEIFAPVVKMTSIWTLRLNILLRIKLKCDLVCELTLRVNKHSNGQESPLCHHYVF